MLVLPLYGFGPFELSFSSSDFSFYQKVGSDGVTYDCIQAPGYSQEYYPPGAPQLPVKVCRYIIPRDKKVDSVKVIDFQLEPIPGSYYICPIQKMVVLGESSPWVPPDTSIYNSDSLYPGEFIRVAHSGSMEGSHLVTIGVYPIQYRPLSRNLHLLASVSLCSISLQHPPL